MPITIPIIAFLRGMLNKYDERAPVHTPVNGKGIPINRIRPNNL